MTLNLEENVSSAEPYRIFLNIFWWRIDKTVFLHYACSFQWRILRITAAGATPANWSPVLVSLMRIVRPALHCVFMTPAARSKCRARAAMRSA
jgi:hypothetical protein